MYKIVPQYGTRPSKSVITENEAKIAAEFLRERRELNFKLIDLRILNDIFLVTRRNMVTCTENLLKHHILLQGIEQNIYENKYI